MKLVAPSKDVQEAIAAWAAMGIVRVVDLPDSAAPVEMLDPRKINQFIDPEKAAAKAAKEGEA